MRNDIDNKEDFESFLETREWPEVVKELHRQEFNDNGVLVFYGKKSMGYMKKDEYAAKYQSKILTS